MSTDIKTLLAFRERFGTEVGGRETSEPPEEMLGRLVRFARGECDEVERTEMCELLRRDPSLLRWVASQVKGGRGKASEEVAGS